MIKHSIKLFLVLVVLGILVVILVLMASRNYKQRLRRIKNLEEKTLTPNEVNQVIWHFSAIIRRDRASELGLSIDDPRIDPNNFPLPDIIATRPISVQKGLFLMYLQQKRAELGITLSEPNEDILNLIDVLAPLNAMPVDTH
jgi:hypothetical protein